MRTKPLQITYFTIVILWAHAQVYSSRMNHGWKDSNSAFRQMENGITQRDESSFNRMAQKLNDARKVNEVAVSFYNKLRRIYCLVYPLWLSTQLHIKAVAYLVFHFYLNSLLHSHWCKPHRGSLAGKLRDPLSLRPQFACCVHTTRVLLLQKVRNICKKKANCVPLVQTKHCQSESTLYEITLKNNFVPTTEKFLLPPLPCFQSVLTLQAGW